MCLQLVFIDDNDDNVDDNVSTKVCSTAKSIEMSYTIVPDVL